MLYSKRSIAKALIIGTLLVPGCTQPATPAAAEEPASVELIDGTDLHRVVLTPAAADRLDIQTAAVREGPASDGGAPRTIIPYGAIFYDATGATWAYTSPQPLTFIRHEIVIESIEGSEAILSSGPPPGTTVVTVGVAELFGTEFEVGH